MMQDHASQEMTVLVDSRHLRHAFGRFATGVTIVTSRFGGEVHGMTANSFSSVSLNPPLLLVCLANQAYTLSLIERSALFGLSVLGSAQRDISEHFACPGDRSKIGLADFCGVPVIDGALAHFSCEVEAQHLAGDHTILVGKILASALQEGPPLVLYSGTYVSLAMGMPKSRRTVMAILTTRCQTATGDTAGRG